LSSDNYSRTEQAVWMRERAKAWERLKLPPPLFQLRQKLGQSQTGTQVSFYTLYGRICDRQTLVAAWNQVRANGGALA